MPVCRIVGTLASCGGFPNPTRDYPLEHHVGDQTTTTLHWSGRIRVGALLPSFEAELKFLPHCGLLRRKVRSRSVRLIPGSGSYPLRAKKFIAALKSHMRSSTFAGRFSPIIWCNLSTFPSG